MKFIFTCLFFLRLLAWGQDAKKEFSVRQMVAEGSPRVFEARRRWEDAARPRPVSLEKCGPRHGPGVVKGAYVAPCRATPRTPAGYGPRRRDCSMHDHAAGPHTHGRRRRASSAPPTALGDGVAIRLRRFEFAGLADGPRPVDTRGEGKPTRRPERFYFIGPGRGALGSSTDSCNGEEGKRIRLQELPGARKPEYDPRVSRARPAYRVRRAS